MGNNFVQECEAFDRIVLPTVDADVTFRFAPSVVGPAKASSPKLHCS
jgi:hypothetical protein